jgi:hypothetical protein
MLPLLAFPPATSAWHRVAFAVVAPLFCLMSATGSALAQTTRAGEYEKEQEAKARSLSTYVPGWFERKLTEIEESGGFAVARGLALAFGDIKRGSGVALGPAYAKHFGAGTLSAKAEYSVRDFKLLQVAAHSAPLARGRLLVSGRARWVDAPELPVYPLGPDSPKTRTNYGEKKLEAGAQAWLRPVHPLRFGAGAAYERFDTNFPTHAAGPEESGDIGFMPGIDADPDYVHSFASAAVDTRTGPGYSRSGSLLQGTLHDYRQQNSGPYSFRRVDGIAQQLIPVLHGNWVLDLSARVSTTTSDAGEAVPFFLMPDLGGGNTLRGFGNYRFRDQHAIVFTAEYRWYVQEFADMAIFYDAGKAVPRRGDLDFQHLKHDIGVGFRLHSTQTTFLRIEVARSREGTSLIFAFGPVFE